MTNWSRISTKLIWFSMVKKVFSSIWHICLFLTNKLDHLKIDKTVFISYKHLSLTAIIGNWVKQSSGLKLGLSSIKMKSIF